MPTSHLILIKHSAPLVEPGSPPETWGLSNEGRRLCKPLADRVAEYHPARIFTSEERKAAETGEILAGELKIPCESRHGLQEHDRGNVPHMRSSEFISSMELLFRRPDELVLGRESARQAADRFDTTLQELVAEFPSQSPAIVSHGTVLAMWLAERAGRTPFVLWRQLGLPSLAVLSLPDLRLVGLVERIVAPLGEQQSPRP